VCERRTRSEVACDKLVTQNVYCTDRPKCFVPHVLLSKLQTVKINAFFPFTKKKKSVNYTGVIKFSNITKNHKNREVQQRADHIHTRVM